MTHDLQKRSLGISTIKSCCFAQNWKQTSLESLDDPQSTVTKIVYNWTCFATVAPLHRSRDPAKITPREHAPLPQMEPHTYMKTSSQKSEHHDLGLFWHRPGQLSVMNMNYQVCQGIVSYIVRVAVHQLKLRRRSWVMQ